MTIATQLAPKRTKGVPSQDGEFVVFEHVACFDEHIGDDNVRYDERLLRCIADNCNRRIRTTKDWCPVVVGHTRDNEDKRSANDDPEVIGFAGPFYVADWINSDGRQVKAIFSTFWIFPDKEQLFLRNPRRSVEIWPEDRPEDRFFDPISCLGAETPKRDLGMIYSRRGSSPGPGRYTIPGPLRYAKRYRGAPPLRYEATCAGGGAGQNTFLPGGTNIRPKKERNSKGADSMTPDDLAQLADALKPMIQAMVEDAVVATQSSEPTEVEEPDMEGDEGLEGEGLEGGALAGMPPAAPPLGGEAPVGPAAGAPPLPPPEMPEGGAEMPPPEGELPTEEPVPGEEGDEFAGLPDEDKQYAKSLGRKFMKYRRGDNDSDDWDDAGADKYMESLDEEDTGMLDKFMKYASGCSKCKKRYAERYGKEWNDDDADDKKDGEPNRYAEGQPSAPMPAGQPAGVLPAAAGKYAKANMATKYRKLATEHEQLKQRYAKTAGELETVSKEVITLRAAERYAKRWARLKDLESEGYCFDPAEEMELTEDFTDDQFDRHTNVTVRQYSRVTSSVFPVERERKVGSVADDKPQRYAKEARKLVDKLRKTGKDVPFADVLRHLIAREGQADEMELLKGSNGKP